MGNQRLDGDGREWIATVLPPEGPEVRVVDRRELEAERGPRRRFAGAVVGRRGAAGWGGAMWNRANR